MSKISITERVHMNYIHIHEKCLKCGECRLECEHRTKWTSASTSTSPNTESDKSIDELFAPLIDSPSLTLTTTYWNEAKSELYSLLMDVIGTDEDETNTKDGITNVRVFSENRNQLRAEQRTKLTELFNVKEK